MPRPRILKLWRNLSYLYLCLICLSVLITQLGQFPEINEVTNIAPGCYTSNAPLIPPIECHGFWGDRLVAFVLSYGKLMVGYTVLTIVHSPFLLVFFPFLPVMWSPVFYLLWYYWQGLKARRLR